MSTTIKHQVVFNDMRIGLIYITINPNNESEKVATIIPIDRSGSWTLGNTTITLKESFTNYYSAEESEEDILKKITALARIEPWRVKFLPTP